MLRKGTQCNHLGCTVLVSDNEKIYINFKVDFKPLNCNTVFTRIGAAALIKFFPSQMRRLFEGGACLKVGTDTEVSSFKSMIYSYLFQKFNRN